MYLIVDTRDDVVVEEFEFLDDVEEWMFSQGKDSVWYKVEFESIDEED